MARLKLNPKSPPRLSADKQARLQKITDEEITAAAKSDADNPLLTDEELDALSSAAFVRSVGIHTSGGGEP